MPAATQPALQPATQELELTRVFEAPRDLVFRAWSDPAHLMQWYGPHGFTNTACEADVRPGGALRIVMRAPDGSEHPTVGTFQEVAPPERLVFTNVLERAPGQVDLEVLVTATFAEVPGGTRVTVRVEVLVATAAAQVYLDGMETGWTQLLERLAAHLATTG